MESPYSPRLVCEVYEIYLPPDVVSGFSESFRSVTPTDTTNPNGDIMCRVEVYPEERVAFKEIVESEKVRLT